MVCNPFKKYFLFLTEQSGGEGRGEKMSFSNTVADRRTFSPTHAQMHFLLFRNLTHAYEAVSRSRIIECKMNELRLMKIFKRLTPPHLISPGVFL